MSRRSTTRSGNRLKDVIKGRRQGGRGLPGRTAAEGASAEDIERDFVFLERLWKTIQARAKKAKAPGADLPGSRAAAADRPRPVRRRLRERAHRPRADIPAHRRLPEEDVAAHGRARPPLQGEGAFLTRYGIDREIESTLSRRVDLPSGGYLVFDYAEASRSSTSTPVASSARARRPRRSGSRTPRPRTISRRSRRSSGSSACATSAASSSSTSSTWRTRRTAPSSRRHCARSLSATGRRRTWSRSRCSARRDDTSERHRFDRARSSPASAPFAPATASSSPTRRSRCRSSAGCASWRRLARVCRPTRWRCIRGSCRYSPA